MKSTIIQVASIFTCLALFSFSDVHGACDNTGGWSKPLYEFMVARNELLAKAYTTLHPDEPEPRKLRDFVQTLREFQNIADNLLKAPLSQPELANDCFMMISHLPFPNWQHSLQLVGKNVPLHSNDEARAYEIDHRIKKQIRESVYGTTSNVAFALPKGEICSEIPPRKFKKDLSIKDLCTNIETCTTEGYPYGQDGTGIAFTEACTSDNKCKLTKAVPMMAGLLWFAASDWMVELMCPETCEQCNVNKTYSKVIHETKLLMAYINIMPHYWTPTWRTFFEDAIQYKAYLYLEQSLVMVEEKEHVLDTTPEACSDLLFTEACPYADIYREFVMIKKIQKYRKEPGLVRDFRHMPNIDFKTRLGQEKDTLRHIELLGTIKDLGENLKVSVTGISQYFQGLATYDEGIAEADVLFIQGELDKFENGLNDVETQTKEDVKTIMNKMIVLVTAELATACATLAAKVAENSNPLKLFFNGPDLSEMIDEAGNVASATSDTVKGAALLIALNGLYEDSLKIGDAFLGNTGQITGLKELVDKIRQDKSDEIGKEADKFLVAYSAYTPQTDRSKLEKNNALWSAFKDATCDILNGDVGVGGAAPQAIVGGKLLCERLEGTLAQFFTLREDTFDFQFQLVDAVAAVVRGNIAKRFAANIQGKGDVLHASQLLIGSYKMHNRFQSTASLACDVLEYQQQGEIPRGPCATVNGIFSTENLNALIAHQFTAPTGELTMDVNIPTQASFEGDTGYIDLEAMKRGETIVFRPPTNRSWLLENGWITSDYKQMPFVQEIQLFLPLKKYKTGKDRQLTTTTITLSSIAASHVTLEPSKKNIAFILPKRHSSFKTVYKEGYTRCSATEMDNPYSLCQNLPKICLMSSTNPGELKLFPTILSTWSLSYRYEQGATMLKWDTPKPATNLLIKAALKLRVPQTKKKRRSHLSKLVSRSDETTSENGCCDGNMFRVSRFNNKCASCPVNSLSHLRGYYCEINEEEEKKETASK